MKQDIENSKGVGLENGIYSRAALWQLMSKARLHFVKAK